MYALESTCQIVGYTLLGRLFAKRGENYVDNEMQERCKKDAVSLDGYISKQFKAWIFKIVMV